MSSTPLLMLPQAVAVEPPPPLPTPTVIQNADGRSVTVNIPGATSPTSVYQAAVAKRDVLTRQLRELTERRDELAQELRNRPDITGADRQGLEKQIAEVDGRISETNAAIAQASTDVANAAGIPGAVPPAPPELPRAPDPEDFIAIPIVFTLFVLFPLTIAWSRRIWKRTGAAVAAIPQAVQDRLARIEQNVDAIAIEVERVSEGQRFMTKLFSDSAGRALGQGAAQPVEVGARERVAERP